MIVKMSPAVSFVDADAIDATRKAKIPMGLDSAKGVGTKQLVVLPFVAP